MQQVRVRKLAPVMVAGLATFAMLGTGGAAYAAPPTTTDDPDTTAIVECVADPTKTVYVTPDSLAGWELDVETKDGTYAFTPEGLAIETTGGKVAGLVPVDFTADTVCLPLMEYTQEDGPHAGFNYRQLPNEDAGRGYVGLVYEPKYYDTTWWSNKDHGVGDNGAGYPSAAALRDYFTVGPVSQIDVAGFTLGTLSGDVHGKGVLDSVVFGDTTYVFRDKAPLPVAEECVATKFVDVTPKNLNGWDLEVETTTGTYDFTDAGLKIAADGGKVAGLVDFSMDATNYCLPEMEFVDAQGAHPGFNYRQLVDEDADRMYAALVYEPVYNGDLWWSTKELGGVCCTFR